MLVSITNTSAVFLQDYGEPAIFYMVADQSPSTVRLAYWMRFLNQDTAVLHGPEKYARLHNFPVVFAFPQKVKRGFYKVRFFMLVEDPSKTAPGEITRLYMNALEKIIQDDAGVLSLVAPAVEAEKRSSEVAKWRNGEMAKWRNGEKT